MTYAKLFIAGFPRSMQEIELVELFSAHGIVNIVAIVRDKESGNSKGYGFITMADDQGASCAIRALDGFNSEDRKLNVRFADENVALALRSGFRGILENENIEDPALDIVFS